MHLCVCMLRGGGVVLGNSVLVHRPASYLAVGPGLQEELGGLKGLTCQVSPCPLPPPAPELLCTP